MASAKERLEAANRAVEERLKARAEKDARETEEREAEAAERELANLDAIEKAESTIGKVGKDFLPVYTDFGVVIVRRCNAMIYNKFQDEGKYTYINKVKLLSSCVAHPEIGVIENWYDQQPHIVNLCCDAVGFLAGIRKEEISGK